MGVLADLGTDVAFVGGTGTLVWPNVVARSSKKIFHYKIVLHKERSLALD